MRKSTRFEKGNKSFTQLDFSRKSSKCGPDEYIGNSRKYFKYQGFQMACLPSYQWVRTDTKKEVRLNDLTRKSLKIEAIEESHKETRNDRERRLLYNPEKSSSSDDDSDSSIEDEHLKNPKKNLGSTDPKINLGSTDPKDVTAPTAPPSQTPVVVDQPVVNPSQQQPSTPTS